MTIEVAIKFELDFIGDGTSTTMSCLIADAPLALITVNGTPVTASFDIASILPSSVSLVSASGGLVVTGAALSVLNTMLSVTFSTAPAAGTVYFVTGTFGF